jgi:FKBP-type peptidyl-prolyl cis-trans isomerase FkpA
MSIQNRMKQFLLILALAFVFAGCLKDEDPCQEKTVQSEQAEIIAYAASNSINATAHPSGLYYEIITPGTGPVPNLNSQIRVIYTGKHLNGQIFDQDLDTSGAFSLAGSIEGWRVGVPLIQEGGRIKLIIPSSMAYGCRGSGPAMPPYSIIYFDVELVDVQ